MLLQGLGKIDPATHGNTMYRSDQANDKQHSISHSCLCKRIRRKMVKNPKVLQDQKQKGDHKNFSCRLTETSSSEFLPGDHLISQILDQLTDLIQCDLLWLIVKFCL